MGIKSKLNKAKSLFHRHGIRGFFTYLIRKILWSRKKTRYCRLFLFVLDTPKQNKTNIQAAADHTFRFATLEDINTLLVNPSWKISDKNLNDFKQGDKCLLQFDGEKMVGYSWLAASPLVEIMWGFHFNMPSNTVYNYKGYTSPEYRGKGAQSQRHRKMLEHIIQNGQHRLFCYVDHLNLNSLKGVRKSGYKKIGILSCTIKNGNAKFNLNISEPHWSKQKRT